MTLATPTAPAAHDIDQQITRIARGTSDIVPRADLKKKLERSAATGKPLQIKLGLDPTAPDIHLGFAVVLRKLRLFQDMGHNVVIIIGDYTALIGDPSGRSSTRPMLTSEQIAANAATYIDQLSRILDRTRMEVRFNSEWLGALSFAELVGLASRMTVAQVMAREDFATRYGAGQPISLHELLYPLAQAYDSVAIHADVEMGGQDQTFNILAGRHLQEQLGMEPQVGLFMPILVGLDGGKKMSKSLGNYVGIAETPDAMFGKLMSISDELMPMYYELCTDIDLDEVRTLTTPPTHPRDAKKRLAREIIAQYHGQSAALAADTTFEAVHGKGKTADAVPDDTPSIAVPADMLDEAGHVRLAALLTIAAPTLAQSAGQAKRLIQQGGVSIDGQRVDNPSHTLAPRTGMVLKVGKSHFARLIAPRSG